jgi:hypothetical protein
MATVAREKTHPFAFFVLAGFLLCFSFGCEAYDVHYVAFTKVILAPSPRASVIDGTVDLASLKRLFERMVLPSTTSRQKFELSFQLTDLYFAQIGSLDYVPIGEVFGGGNARVNFDKLDAEFCKRAAANGGDVVLVFNRQTEDHPYVSSYASGNAYFVSGYAEGGVNRLPSQNGIVFKYVPGHGQLIEPFRHTYQQLSDRDLDRIFTQSLSILSNDKLTFEQAEAQISALRQAALASEDSTPPTNALPDQPR